MAMKFKVLKISGNSSVAERLFSSEEGVGSIMAWGDGDAAMKLA
jgi:hypothetical protein